jgi:hypothetical protein
MDVSARSAVALADLHGTFTGPPDGGTGQASSVLTTPRMTQWKEADR